MATRGACSSSTVDEASSSHRSSKFGPAAVSRIPPLPRSEWSEDVERLLGVEVPGGRAGASSNFLATLARDPGLLRVLMRSVGRLLVDSALPRRDRELLILRSAWLCQTGYSWGEHVRLAHEDGLTTADVERVVCGPDAQSLDFFERALLTAVDELHDDATITDATWETLASRYTEAQLLEVPMLAGLYHLVSWTQNAAQVEPDPGRAGLEAR